MARRSQHSFLKRQKENKRKEEALQKMARRQGKAKLEKEVEGIEGAEAVEQEEPSVIEPVTDP
jgi:hypothetical protein